MKRWAMLGQRRIILILLTTAFFFGFVGMAMGSGEEGAAITVLPDKSVFLQIVNFLFLVWIMNVLVYKPIRKILLERKSKVDGLREGIETKETKALEKDKAYAVGLKKARAKGLEEKENESVES